MSSSLAVPRHNRKQQEPEGLLKKLSEIQIGGGAALKIRRNTSPAPPHGCPLTHCLSVFGGAWAPNVIWNLSGGPRRFGELKRDIPGISSNVGVWALEPEADTVGAWLDSCVRLRHVAEGTDPLILPGHKLPFRGVDHRLGQLIENHHSALERIRKALSEGPRTAAQMFRPIFLRDIRGSQYGLALAEAVAHMNHLMKLGWVRRDLVDGTWVYAIEDGA